MKKYLLLLLAGSMMVLSCKKDRSKGDTPNGGDKPSTKQYAVTFTVGSGTSLGTAAVSGKLAVNDAGTDTLKKYVRTLSYMVYDNTGALIREVNQTAATTANYGVYSDVLSPGTYTVAFLGNSIVLNTGTDRNNFTFSDPVKKDIFYQNFTLTVTNTAINQPIALKRLAGQIQVAATDVVPANVDSLTVNISYKDYSRFVIKTGGGFGNPLVPAVIRHTFTAAERGKSNFKMSTLYFNVKTPANTSWRAADVSIYRYPQSAFKAIISISNVVTEPGKITVLSGHLFDNIVYNGGFQISFDPVWTPITVNY